MKNLFVFSFLFISISLSAQNFEREDVFPTVAGDLKITCIGHGTLMIELDSFFIHVDPVSREADYSIMPKADLILITHHHGDHLDGNAIEKILTDSTLVIMTKICSENLEYADQMNLEIMANGEKIQVEGIDIEAIPAYNIQNKRSNGQPFHPKGEGNGYVLAIDDFKLLIAGDTENTPEIKS